MTEALNPALPIGGSQVQIASEFRGIKSRLVLDKEAIEVLQVDVDPVNNAGATGLELLDSVTSTEARTALDFGAFGSMLADVADLSAAQALLGIVNQAAVFVGTPERGTIILSGGSIKINVGHIYNGGGDGEVPVVFYTPFTAAVFGVVTDFLDRPGGGTPQYTFVKGPTTLLGTYLDSMDSGNRNIFYIAFGI